MAAQQSLQFISCHPKFYTTFVTNLCLFLFPTVMFYFMTVSASAVQNCWQKLWLPSSAPSSPRQKPSQISAIPPNSDTELAFIIIVVGTEGALSIALPGDFHPTYSL